MERRFAWRTLVIVTALVLVLFAQPSLTFAVGPRIPGPRFSTSTNWGGYASLTSLTAPQAGSVSFVGGRWEVTPVNATAVNAWSASWVGIDGYASGTVEQIGTESDWINGRPVYSAWYEMYPKRSMRIPMTISPGDVMSASVQYNGKSGFTLTLINTTTGARFSITQKSNAAKRSSSEWILEPPWSGGVLPLADVGVVPFDSAQTIINGHLGAINDSRWTYDAITIVSSAGNTVAVPSGLSSAGSAFTMTWMNPN